MKLLTVLLALGCLSTTISCGGDSDIMNIPFAAGTVAGAEWSLRYGRSAIDVRDRELAVSLFSQDELAPNACQIVTTNNAHLTIVTPSSVGNYTIPGLDANLFFQQPGSLQSFQATSGFVEVTEIVGNRVSGILLANFDDDNNVEGRFIAEICN